MITSVSEAEIGLYAIATLKPPSPIPFTYKFNLSHFRDPQGQITLRKLTGKDAEVQAFILADPRTKAIIHAAEMIAAEKAKWVSMGFYDHHGRWISAGMIELIAKQLDAANYKVAICHQW